LLLRALGRGPSSHCLLALFAEGLSGSQLRHRNFEVVALVLDTGVSGSDNWPPVGPVHPMPTGGDEDSVRSETPR